MKTLPQPMHTCSGAKGSLGCVACNRGQPPDRQMLVIHPARGCVRFKCSCGLVLTWQHRSNGKRIPEHKRSRTCECGVVHTR